MRWSLPVLLATICVGAVAADGSDIHSIDGSWKPERWNKTQGSLTAVVDGRQQGSPAGTIEVSYAGTGFEWFVINPPAPLSVANASGTVSLWVKGAAPGYPIVVKFQDVKGSKRVDDKDLEWQIHGVTGEWQQKTFAIPPEWARPVSIYAIAVHNWDHQNEAAKITYQVSDLATAP